MNFKDEMKQKVAQIEIILDEYLPAQEGLQKTVLISDVWRKGRYRKAIYGSN